MSHILAQRPYMHNHRPLMYVARDSAPSKILGFVKVWPENWCKSVKVWCLRDPCKTVKVSDPPETLPPPYVFASSARQQTAAVSRCVSELHGKKYRILEIYPFAARKPVRTCRGGLQGQR